MFKEHNNRKNANKLAEYITGEPLRRYMAEKVKHYAGDEVSVFDGAAGSGQLLQFVKPTKFVAVEIQTAACETLASNFPRAEIYNESFFVYPGNAVCDCVVMNPPFSLKFKDLSESEKQQVQSVYPWKKSGVLDDIFVLKGLEQSSRWGFFILFPGVGYRAAEKQFRELIGVKLVELNRIQNAFEDTKIEVLFIVVDKAKTSNTAMREIVDFKTNERISGGSWEIDTSHWETAQKPLPIQEALNPIYMEQVARNEIKAHLLGELRFSKFIVKLENNSRCEFNQFCDELCSLIVDEKF